VYAGERCALRRRRKCRPSGTKGGKHDGQQHVNPGSRPC
jgi:hypothetical protein